MRCYLMRKGHIASVAILTIGASDEQLIAEAKALFKGCAEIYDGFEVWDRERFIFRFPPENEGPPKT